MHLNKVAISIDKRGVICKTYTYKYTASKKNYLLSHQIHEDGEHETINKRVSFDSLMIPQTIFHENHRQMRYTAWCLPEQIEETKQILKDKILAKIKEIKEDLEHLYHHIPLLTII